MNFVRKGPGYLFLRSEKPEVAEEKLLKLFGAKKLDFRRALEVASEDDTIVFISPLVSNKTRVGDASGIIVISDKSLALLVNLINKGSTDYIHKIDIAPGQLVMRIPAEGLEVIREIKEFYKAKVVGFKEGINEGEAEDTIISFTEKPLRSNINSLQLVKQNLLINRPVESVYHKLRRDSVRFITHGLDHSHWYELKINIYDSADNYELQYERLVTVLADLEVGFILGESWTRDHAIALLSVVAYQVRLFSLMAPREIKKILFSLEYDSEGKRIVDYDLYHQSDKISWTGFATGSYERKEIGVKLREELLGQLSDESRERLRELEKELLK